MSVFITGIDTDVGKTVVASWVALKMGWSYFKPIQTGCMPGMVSDSDFVSAMGVSIYPEHYRLRSPLSPYVAASKEGVSFNIKTLRYLPTRKSLVVEGAGGVLVPITVNFDMIDLIKAYNLPVLLVTKAELGTINHTRLTLAMLNLRNIEVIGVVMVGVNEDNKTAIENLSGVRVLFQMPVMNNVDRESLDALEMSDDLYKVLRFINVNS